jgi:hypothetical protein
MALVAHGSCKPCLAFYSASMKVKRKVKSGNKEVILCIRDRIHSVGKEKFELSRCFGIVFSGAVDWHVQASQVRGCAR